MQTSLIINAVDPAGKANQKTVTFANSNSSDSELFELSTALNDLTDNTFSGATRIDKTALNSKQTPTLTLSETTAACGDIVAITMATANFLPKIPLSLASLAQSFPTFASSMTNINCAWFTF